MNEKDKIRSEARAKILKALGHPSRIFMIDRLNERPHCVCELTELVGSDTSTVSKHLSVLKQAGVVSDRKEGTSVYYYLTCPCILNLLGCIEGVIETNLQKQLAYFKEGTENDG